MKLMKRENIYKILYVCSTLLVIGFAIECGVDIYKYNAKLYIGSAPLYLYILVNAIIYLLPSLVLFLVGVILKKKFAKR